MSGKTAEPARGLRPVSNVALYEYTGLTGMSVRGLISGATYRFGQPGAKVPIDPRDVSSMAGLPNLRQLR